MTKHTKVAVITGARRGLGREVGRQLIERGWQVVLTARTLEAAEAAGLQGAWPAALDVADAAQARTLADEVAARFGRVDAVVNNAAILADDPGVLTVDPAEVVRSFDNNTAGALRVAQAFAPALVASRGTLTQVSSGMGAMSDMGPGHPCYRLSKVALNALTLLLHHELHPKGVRVNAVCPGWVKTDMGGPGATRELPHGASGIVWAATLGADGPSGGFFRDGKAIPW